MNLPLTKSFLRLNPADKDYLLHFQKGETAYFADYIGKVMLEDLKKPISKANYFLVLYGGSTDSAITEQEGIYIFYICVGAPLLKYFSIKNVKTADAPGLKSTLEVVALLAITKNK